MASDTGKTLAPAPMASAMAGVSVSGSGSGSGSGSSGTTADNSKCPVPSPSGPSLASTNPASGDALDAALPGRARSGTTASVDSAQTATSTSTTATTATTASTFVSARIDFAPAAPASATKKATASLKAARVLLRARAKAGLSRLQVRRQPPETVTRTRTERVPLESDTDESDGETKTEKNNKNNKNNKIYTDKTDKTDTEEKEVGNLLDQLADWMAGGSSKGATASRWHKPGYLPAFLRQCLDIFEVQEELIGVHADMQAHIQQTHEALDSLQKRVQELEAENARLRQDAAHSS